METNYSTTDSSPGRRARERMLEDLKALGRDAEDLIKATAENASEKASEARLRLAAALERAKVTCQELQQESLESARVAMQKADDTIRTHPYESIGIALGVGVLLGALLRGR